MTRAIHLIAWFLAGCIASTILSWIATLHPAALRFTVSAYLLIGVFWLAFMIFDDALLRHFEMTILEYRAVLVSIMVAAFIGIGVGVAVCWQSI